MNTPTRIGLYAAGLVAVFAASTIVASALAPAGIADRPATPVGQHTQAGHSAHPAAPAAPSVRGLAIAQDGYLLEEVTAPGAVGEAGELAFRITDPHGGPLTRYTDSHDKELHLIVVRSDGAHFRHVHPERDAGGTWSLPWTWEAGGSYRVYVDFVPADAPDSPGVTLTRTVEVAGDYAPVSATPSTTTSVDGFDVTLHGDLRAGATSELTAEVTRDGEPVTALEPYLGAFGHLVALRQGDLAYLHVHPEGGEPSPDERSGPDVTFVTEAPTEGRYLLYLDFQVAGQVRTAAFTLDTAGSAAEPAPTQPATPPAEPGAPATTDGHDH